VSQRLSPIFHVFLKFCLLHLFHPFTYELL
jgi:hypothetical protein